MPLPPIKTLLTQTPLYEKITLIEDDKDQLRNLLSGQISFDGYCLKCERETPFRLFRASGGGAGMSTPKPDWMFQDRLFHLSPTCTRCGSKMQFEFRLEGRTLEKYGQFPSIADLAGAELKGFRSVLSSEDYTELNRSIGLISHGVGIGAFVYLRRIFERLVENYADQLKKTGELAEGFDSLRMGEKVAELKEVLPKSVYEYREAYGILSLGIHELSEDDCRAAHPVIYAAVRMMLEEDVHKKEKAKAEAELKAEFEALKSRSKPKKQVS